MVRILVIQCILAGLLGAIAYRLAWAFGHSRKLAWTVAIILATVVLFVLPGTIDDWIIREYGGRPSQALDLGPFVVNLLGALCLLLGAWLASLVVRRRIRLGLEEEPPYKDFP
jgi:hypothetical protein